MVSYPKDWKAVQLGERCKITSSKRVFEREWTKSGIPFLRTRDIANFHTRTESKDKLFISEQTYANKVAVSGKPQQGDLLVTGVGTIGLPYLIINDSPIYFKDGNILWIKKCEAIAPKWLYLLFLSDNIKKQIKGNSGFTTVGTFTIQNAKKLEIHLPSLEEQQAIADTLTTFDNYIADLNELVEKKKAVREGVLEDLMSGKTRLEGFSGEWKEDIISNICKVYDGTHQTPKYVNRGIRFVSVENIKDIYKSNKYISSECYKLEFKIRPEKDDILMTRIGDIGTPCLVDKNEPIAYYVSLALLKDIVINSLFLCYYIKSRGFQKELDNRTLHHATPKKINKGEIGKCRVKFPEKIREQECIASILKNMDDEIRDLEAKRDKMIDIRDGAMDDLLTGRVRLPL